MAPPEIVGTDGSGRITTRVKAPGDGRTFAAPLFERDDIPVYPPGTVAECFASGEEAGASPG